ncbi:CinA family protein [Kaistella carnis]|uniref:CinA family protein n=1 Tax=Kaistella carnis TaxID=1241979 RepID=UPI00289FF6ED|nr:nicotinamide-nucleotide amidohydrolase family protein [Kaistella carnis]
MKSYDLNELCQLTKHLLEAKLTIAVAESCTSGLLQNAFSLAEDSMSFYQGGMTVYNAAQKAMHLSINPIIAEECNSVSKEIAEKMCLKIAEKFNTEVGVSITGYATPIPKENITSSYAYIAGSINGKIVLSKRIKGDPKNDLYNNQILYVNKIIRELNLSLST